ncbi:hypothetical protein PPL_02882 [Heterostelium album PN500]|uniref:Adenylate kinase isoenzyme 6 homolog n=1 Tax=Heterostelium pallidum (strain ATCC 26659 / Pp 5 / PN500) TaxID=670386 RepID=D3B3B6_HETP5|nr:hypothetical protein PPL_02882 [Heterostelium album PN500]EFA83814.1 hypothetical protein PPL_02882 [Heterostelium album PN500]|eukprot:XP_020435931.1 hypothetical protein PPL_02882 [Heterostelium album PN500]
MSTTKRVKPNILITGTPGTGKTSLSEILSNTHDFKHVDISALVKEKELHDGWDDEFQCYILDEDKVCDELEETMNQGGIIVDHHGCEWFPERWFDLVIVLRTDTKILNERLKKRNYNTVKIENNIDCEIYQMILEEAKNSYKHEIVKELQSTTIEDNEHNQQIIGEWINSWNKQ